MLMVLLLPESTAIWKTNLDCNICGIDLKYDWCGGIRNQSGDCATVVINVYLPL